MPKNRTAPYVGPRPFGQQDQAIFFGREREAGDLLSLIIANRVLLIYARSGAGKTSLLNAKLIPMLKGEGIDVVLPMARVQGRIPKNLDLRGAENVNVYVMNALMGWKQEGDERDLAGMTLSEFFHRPEPASSTEESGRPRLIVFDQFEELFTFYPDRWQDRLDFFQQVNELLEGSPLTLRPFDLKDASRFFARLGDDREGVSRKLRERLTPQARQLLESRKGAVAAAPSKEETGLLLSELNRLVQGESLYDEEAFAGVALKEATRRLLERKARGREVQRLNRLLLEDAYAPHVRALVEGDPMLRIVFSMREDYIAELDPYASVLPDKLRTRYRLEPLRKSAALAAINGPLEETSLHFGAGVAERLIENLLRIPRRAAAGTTEITGQFIEPVQLQVVCQTLWESVQLSGASEITLAHLEEHGNVDKALRAFYEKSIQAVIQTTSVKEWVLRRWFDDVLITTAGTRGTVFRGETTTGGLANTVVDELEKQNIIRAELRGGERWYELSHDRFIPPVRESNNEWRLGHSGAMQRRKELEDKAAAWVRQGRGEQGLLDESAAVEAWRWVGSPEATEVGYSDDLYSFVQSSRVAVIQAAQERERLAFERERQQAAAIAAEQQQRAEAERQQAEERERRIEAERQQAQIERRRAEEQAAARQRDIEQAQALAAQQQQLAEAARARAEEQEKLAAEQHRLAQEQRQRAEEKAESNRRLRRLVAAFAVVCVLAVLAAGAAAYQSNLASRKHREADAERRVAEAETHRANEQAGFAEQNAKEARKAKDEADIARRAAEENAAKARKQTELAEAETLRANQQEQRARSETTRANEQAALARKETQRANEQTELVKQAKDQAVAKAEEAKRERDRAQLAEAEAIAKAREAKEERDKAQLAEAEAKRLRDEAVEKNETLKKAIADLKAAKTVDELNRDALDLQEAGDLEGSIKKYREALKIYEADNNLAGQAQTLDNIAEALSLLEKTREAIETYNSALKIYERQADAPGQAKTYFNIAAAHLKVKNYDSAVENLRNAERIYKLNNDDAGQIQMLRAISDIQAESGNKMAAIKTYDEVLAIKQPPYAHAFNLLSLGYIQVEVKDYEGAIKSFKDSQDIYDDFNDISGEANAYQGMGQVYFLQGKFGEALKALDDADAKRKMTRDIDPGRHTAFTRGQIYAAMRRFDEALASYQIALKLYEGIIDKSSQIAALREIAEVYRRMGREKEAQEYLRKAQALQAPPLPEKSFAEKSRAAP